MKKYTILFLLAFLTGPAFGQIMKGFVYDKETNEPLAGVNITYKRITGETNGTIPKQTVLIRSTFRKGVSTCCSVTSVMRTNRSR